MNLIGGGSAVKMEGDRKMKNHMRERERGETMIKCLH